MRYVPKEVLRYAPAAPMAKTPMLALSAAISRTAQHSRAKPRYPSHTKAVLGEPRTAHTKAVLGGEKFSPQKILNPTP